MNRSYYYLAIVLAVAATLGFELLFGRLSQGEERELLMADGARRIQNLPEHFGPWQAEEAFELTDRVASMLKCRGYLSRRYRNTQTGESVNVNLIVGEAGPLVVHRPEVCFSNREYELVGKSETAVVRRDDGRSDALLKASFRATTVDARLVVAYFGWNRGQGWEAPADPRFELAAEPWLYKLQVVGGESDFVSSDEVDPARRFLDDLLPQLDRELFDKTTAPQ